MVMVKIFHPNPIMPAPVARPRDRTNDVASSAPTHEQKQEVAATAPFVERRKSRSDRREKRASRGQFDMRSGRDRRKNSGPYPSIEIDV